MEADLLFPWTTNEFVVQLNLLVPECFIGVHRYSFLPPRGSFRVTRAIYLFFFRYGNAMHAVSEVGLFLMMKNLYLRLVMLEDDCRYLMVSKIPMVGISLKAQTDINGFLEGYLRHFSACKPTGRSILVININIPSMQ